MEGVEMAELGGAEEMQAACGLCKGRSDSFTRFPECFDWSRRTALSTRFLARELPRQFRLPHLSASPPLAFEPSQPPMATTSESIESYLKSVIQPLTTDLATDMLPITPQDPESFITGWLRQRAPHHQAPMSLRRRNEALKQELAFGELSALEGELSAASHGGGAKDLLDSHGGARAEDCGGNDMQDFDLSFAMTGLPQMQAPFKRGQLWQYQPRTDTWEKVLVLLGPGILETFAETTEKRQALLMLGATGSAKPEHEKLPPESEGYAFEVSNFVQAEPALTHLRLVAPTEQERREWLLAINGHAAGLQVARHHTPQTHQSVLFGSRKMLAHRVSKAGLFLSPTKTTMLLCKMGATIAMLYAELRRLKSSTGFAPAQPAGEEMAQLVRRLSRLEQQVQPEETQEPRKLKREGDEVDPATMPKDYDSALARAFANFRPRLEAFSEELKETYEPSKDLVDMMGKEWQKRRSFSTKMNYQPYQNTLEELFAFCKDKAPIFFAKVRDVSERTGGENVEPPLKGMQRCQDKAQFKYKDKNGEVSWHRLTDIVRDTIVYKNLDDMYKGLRAIHEDEEIDIIECNDRYMNPLDGGYRDLQLSLRIEGMVCELQLNTKWMLHVKENAGHRAFEVSREVMAAVAEPNAVERCHNILQWGKENLGPNADAELQEMLNDDKKGLLHKAAKAGNAHLVSIFLAFRADVNHRDPKMRRTPLHEAMAQGHERAMWALLCARADLQARDNDGQVPLLDGLLKLRQSGGDEGVARLVSVAAQCADGGLDQLREAKDDLGAAVKRRLVQSQELIASCAGLNAESLKPPPILVVETLATKGPPLEKEAMYATEGRSPPGQMLFLQRPSSFPFGADGNLAKVQQLLAEWADPNTPSSAKDGHPPLHAVLLRPQGHQPVHFEILRALLDMDADLGVTTAMPAGETPRTLTLLHCALHSKSGKAVKMLAAAGLQHEGICSARCWMQRPCEVRSRRYGRCWRPWGSSGCSCWTGPWCLWGRCWSWGPLLARSRPCASKGAWSLRRNSSGRWCSRAWGPRTSERNSGKTPTSWLPHFRYLLSMP
ncbi:ACBP4 [Symbiodinium sp. CCMP2592]|nr:ACBP4 [Symbiodinium sp. CCMP2592]